MFFQEIFVDFQVNFIKYLYMFLNTICLLLHKNWNLSKFIYLTVLTHNPRWQWRSWGTEKHIPVRGIYGIYLIEYENFFQVKCFNKMFYLFFVYHKYHLLEPTNKGIMWTDILWKICCTIHQSSFFFRFIFSSFLIFCCCWWTTLIAMRKIMQKKW